MITESSSYSILVCDDDELLNAQLCSVLEERGYRIFSALSLQEARELLGTISGIDLLLLDYQLGDGQGLELVRETSLPVMMISVLEDAFFLENCFDYGVSDYLIKPVNIPLLVLKVRTLLESLTLQELIREQKKALEQFKAESKREEEIAKFTYEYLFGQKTAWRPGVEIWIKSLTSFSGDVALMRESPSGDGYFLLADATGHGLSAAITIMPVVSIFNSMVEKGFDLPSIVTEINKKLVQSVPDDRFVAALLVQFRWRCGEMLVWNGAMPPAVWCDAGRILDTFPSQHMALGILEDGSFNAKCYSGKIPATGSLLAYSDGLLDARNGQGEVFSHLRVNQVIRQNPPALLPALVDALHSYHERSDFDDDVSICLLTPSVIAAGAQDVIGEITSDIKNSFSWQIQLCGQQLANSDLAGFSDHILQMLTLDRPARQRAFSLISELLAYGLDGRLLQLDPALRQQPDALAYYFEQRRLRLTELTEADTLLLQVSCKSGDSQVLFSLEDSGKPYAAQAKSTAVAQLDVLRQLASRIELEPPGNRLCAYMAI